MFLHKLNITDTQYVCYNTKAFKELYWILVHKTIYLNVQYLKYLDSLTRSGLDFLALECLLLHNGIFHTISLYCTGWENKNTFYNNGL